MARDDRFDDQNEAEIQKFLAQGTQVNPFEAIMQFLGMRNVPATRENIDAVMQDLDPALLPQVFPQSDIPQLASAPNPRPRSKPESVQERATVSAAPRQQSPAPTELPPSAPGQGQSQGQGATPLPNLNDVPSPPPDSLSIGANAQTGTDAGVLGLGRDAFDPQTLATVLAALGLGTYAGFGMNQPGTGLTRYADTPERPGVTVGDPTRPDPRVRNMDVSGSVPRNPADDIIDIEVGRRPPSPNAALEGPGTFPRLPGSTGGPAAISGPTLGGPQLPPPAPISPSNLPPLLPQGGDTLNPHAAQQIWQSMGLPQNEMSALTPRARIDFSQMSPMQQYYYNPAPEHIDPRMRDQVMRALSAIRGALP